MEKDTQVVAQSNALTGARYQLDLVEKRCLYKIIREVRRKYIETTEGDKNIFHNLVLSIPRKDIDELCPDNKRLARASLKNLRHRDFDWEGEEVDEDGYRDWINCGFIAWSQYSNKTRTYEIEVPSVFLPFLVCLAEQYTEYDITLAISLRSKYTQRFYELCCQYRRKGKFFLDIESLRQMLCLEDKYPNFAHLKNKVIDIAQKELRELYESGESDICFTYTEDKKTKVGKQVTRLWFQVVDRNASESLDYKKVDDMLRAITIKLGELYKKDKKFVRRVIDALQLHPDKIEPLFDKINTKLSDYPSSEIAPLLRYILKEDFGIR